MNQIFKIRLEAENCHIGTVYQWKEDYTGEFSHIELIENKHDLEELKRYINQGDIEYYGEDE